MITIKSTRTKGHGQGSLINFPTINCVVENLPDELNIGLYATKVSKDWDFYTQNALSAISKTESGYRIETHIVSNVRELFDVGDKVNLRFLSKLRGYKKITGQNRDSVIEKDKQLAKNYFAAPNKCDSCKFFLAQDFGYSNYTVEGTTFECLKGVFSHTEDEDVKFCHKNCQKFESGKPWMLDVDGDVDEPTEDWLTENNCSR